MRGFDTSGFIESTKRAEPLSPGAVEAFIHAFMEGHVTEAQAAAWMMAVRLRGISDAAAAALTKAMWESGASVDLSSLPHTADKHSTGGVGDTVSLIACPLAAAAGATVAKMSGRGLGHTGGTIDKLEAIPGFRVGLSAKEFLAQARTVGLVISSQTADLAPADKRLYALRHETATTDSIPLIAASIMSKKLAAGASAIVLDVKCGRGAFMRSREDAVRLARLLASIGRAHGRRVAVAVTPMDQPLGNAVGHSLEVKEAVEMLRGSGPADLREVSLAIAARMAALSGAAPNEQSARQSVEAALLDGTGLAKLRAMVKAQGGDPRVVDEPQRLPEADCVDVLRAPGSGHVRSIDALRVGRAVEVLGGSRRGSHEVIDRAVGIVLRRREGDEVAGGDVLAEIHASSRASLADALPVLTGAIRMGDKPSSAARALEVEWVE